MVGLRVMALAGSTVPVVPLVVVVLGVGTATAAAAALSVGAAPNVSRRTAASIIHVSGVSAGAAGVLPANELASAASRREISVGITVAGC